jgi:hypothetical protein
MVGGIEYAQERHRGGPEEIREGENGIAYVRITPDVTCDSQNGFPMSITEKAKLQLESLLNRPSIEAERTRLKGEQMVHVKERVRLAQELTVSATPPSTD